MGDPIDELWLDDFTDYGMERQSRPPAGACPECGAGLCRC